MSIGAIFYFLVLFDFGFDPGRTAVRLRFASNFFDIQATAFLKGHLDVPANSLGIEGFVVDGRTYEYFPPFPALLRIPVMLVTHEFDGRLTLPSMALAWVVLAVVAVKLLWLVRTCLRGTDPVGRGEAVLLSLVLATITGGTVLVFDAALPWAYHEVYLWATALVLGALYWLLRVTLAPTRGPIAWLLAFNVCAVLTRTTGGFATCLATLGVAGWLLTGRPHPRLRRWAWLVAATAVIPLLVAVAYNWVKFHNAYLFPLEDQVFTSVNPRRREALARNGGTITGPQFLLTGIVNYLRPDGIRFTDYFPYLTLPARPAPAYGGAFLDQSYRTGSVAAFMPLLVLTSLWGAVVSFIGKHTFAVRALRLPLLGAIAVPVGVLDYGYVTHRYTSEFVPFLVLGAIVGCCDIARRLTALRARWRRVAVGVVAALAAFGLLANSATAYTAAQQTWGGDKLVQYVALQRALAGTPPVTHSSALPSSARTDELHIVGNCDGLYVASGDQYQPWLAVQQRLRRARVIVGADRLQNSLLTLFTVNGVRTSHVQVEISRQHLLRFRVTSSAGVAYGPWVSANRGEEVDLTISAHTDYGLLEVSSLPGGFVTWVPLADWDAEWHSVLSTVTVTLAPAASQQADGVRLAIGATAVPPLCGDLARDAGVQVGR